MSLEFGTGKPEPEPREDDYRDASAAMVLERADKFKLGFQPNGVGIREDEEYA